MLSDISSWPMRLAPLLVSALALAACNALLDIDHVEFGDPAPAAGGSNSGGAGGSGNTGGDPNAEQCLNGMDDDGDGMIDCADPDCGSFSCQNPIPDGWLGPVLAYLGPAATAPPECTSVGWTLAATLNDDIVAPDASCSACSCGSPSGGSCGRPTLTDNSLPMCGGTSTSLGSASGSCTQFTVQSANRSISSSYTPISNRGSCNPSGGDATVPPASWDTTVQLCEGDLGGGCDDAQACAPTASTPFVDMGCIYQEGDMACPTGYDDKYLAYRTFDDTRRCSSCDCDDPDNGSCTSHTNFYDTPNCSGSPMALDDNPNDCLELNTVTAGSYENVRENNNPGTSCDPFGGTPLGSASPTIPVTICCGEGVMGGGGAGGTGGAGGN